jgi:hypothetical protein
VAPIERRRRYVMALGTTEPAQENLCDVADAIRGRLAEIHDRLDRLQGAPCAQEKTPESSGLENVLNACRTEAERALNRLDGAVRLIGHL